MRHVGPFPNIGPKAVVLVLANSLNTFPFARGNERAKRCWRHIVIPALGLPRPRGIAETWFGTLEVNVPRGFQTAGSAGRWRGEQSVPWGQSLV